jgi:hypothetical protein
MALREGVRGILLQVLHKEGKIWKNTFTLRKISIQFFLIFSKKTKKQTTKQIKKQ